MYYRIVTAPPGYGPNEKYMVCVYDALELQSMKCSLENSDGRPFFATLEEARSMLPSTARQMPFEKDHQFLELWQDGGTE
jgi:hypothetical protein